MQFGLDIIAVFNGLPFSFRACNETSHGLYSTQSPPPAFCSLSADGVRKALPARRPPARRNRPCQLKERKGISIDDIR